ncbi:hypothetical protein BJ965_003255 [Streptomyces luteogriseus]|uniref:Uncharacterized protein n=1 Tax=Streptomyces luteogriseus TaxID=68233 RepID=A0A7W7GIG9_9ACTN|nr:hypothetical protein [Streptomyces luteogriseus]MBB4713373.1 hypothetical protein [Streptomyces luteogriseus]
MSVDGRAALTPPSPAGVMVGAHPRSEPERHTVFGKNRHVDEPPVPLVPWTDAWAFAITEEERPAGGQRKRAALGVRAFRVPQGPAGQRVNAPCAFFPPQPSDADARRLYEDAEGTRLLCSLDEPQDIKGRQHYEVRDARGDAIGTVQRIAPLKRALKPTWRIAQPGRPEIVSSAEWAKGGPREMVQRGAGKLLLGVVQAVADMGAEGGDRTSGSRVLEWKAGDELVLTSESDLRFLVRAAWLDRRLVFAYALLRMK